MKTTKLPSPSRAKNVPRSKNALRFKNALIGLLSLVLALILTTGLVSARMPGRAAASATDNALTVPVVGALGVNDVTLTTTLEPEADPLEPFVSHSVRTDVSPALRSMMSVPAETGADKQEEPDNAFGDAVLRGQASAPDMPAPVQSFDGIGNVDEVQPPAPQGDVGPNHYVQWVNLSFAIWDKSGNLLYGPANGNVLWDGFGGPCEMNNDGGPITLYDPLADRWLMSQPARPNYPQGPFYQCMAVSQSGDPTGAWYRYEFVIPVSKVNEYPKLGVWPDGYYLSVNQFYAGSLTGAGAGVAAFEREKMLNGKVARMVYFDVGAVTPDFGNMLPADLDGLRPPPDGSPNYFVEWDDSTQFGDASDTLRLWEFHLDWATPANSTFGLADYAPNVLLPTADVEPSLCGFSVDCIPQPGTSQRLDAVSDRLMYRLQYCNFGRYETLVTNHTVDADGKDRAGIHWFELRKSAGDWSVHQEGVYAPDADHRWMGSIAMDRLGNVALGYSVASADTFPSIRYTGRLADDPLGTMAQGEAELVAGTGSQTVGSDWGDYSAMAVDPEDDCTFWYTQEYYQTDGEDWQTRIGSFKFPNCTSDPLGVLTGSVYEQGGTPASDYIPGASVWGSAGVAQMLKTITGSEGRYKMLLPTGTYTITAGAYGYQTGAISAISIISGTTTTLDIPLAPVAAHTLEGTIADAAAGWPLYAHVMIRGDPFDPPAPDNSFWNDPVTGHYSVTLAEGVTHTVDVEAWVPGYLRASRDFDPLTADQAHNWTLEPAPSTCTAPGYASAYAYSEDFEANDGGYTHWGPNDEWEWGRPTVWPAGCVSGSKCWGTDLDGYYDDNADQTLYSPIIDLSDVPTNTTVIARWWQAWAIESAYWDQASVDVSINGDLWTNIWRHTGDTTQMDWTEMSHDVSAAAGGSVQFRWRLISEDGINFEGFYVDQVSVAAGCVPPAGGLIIGNVYDDNTHIPMVGATVANDSGGVVSAFATSGDPDVMDAFYTLFSPTGSHVFSATMSGGYGFDAASVTVVQSETVRQDFYVPAGWLTYTPESLAVTLRMGMSTTLPLTLSNLGGMPAAFELAEEEGSFQLASSLGPVAGHGEWLHRATEGVSLPANGVGNALAYPAVYRWKPTVSSRYHSQDQISILVYADDAYHTAPNTHLDGALQALGLAYTAHYDASWNSFETDLTSGGPWDLVLVGNDSWLVPASVLTELNDYVIGGGKLIYHGWTVDADTSNLLWATLGFTWARNDYAPPDPVYWWEPAHPFFNDPQDVPAFTSLTSARYGIYGQRVEPLTGFQALAGYTPSGPTPNEAALILGNNDRTVFKGFLDGQNDADLDGDTIPDGVELWINMISGLLDLFGGDLDWLSEEPISGALGTAGEQVIAVTFDAGASSVTQPGDYTTSMVFANDTPYGDLGFPVTMTVPPPATWGKVEGTVTSLGYCDANPTPLQEATLLVTGTPEVTWHLTTDISGTFRLWLEQGSYAVTVSAPDHVTSSAAVTVTAKATTTQDFGLRSMVPCISVTPLSMAATLIPGASQTEALRLTNSGAAMSPFRLREQEGGAMTATLKLSDWQGSIVSPLDGGGPDGFGYVFRDSDEPDGPTYDWIEIAPPAGGDGIAVGLSGVDDGYYWPLALPFPFNFFGTDYTELSVASNGTVYFEDRYLGLDNTSIPGSNSYGVDAFIAHFWDDLVISPGEVYYLAQDDTFIVEYYRVRGYGGYGNDGTWQVILFENGSILFQYQDASIGGSRDYGALATIGIQGDKATGLQYSYNTPALSDDLAICFAYPGESTRCVPTDVPWLFEEPVADTVSADGFFDVQVTFKALLAMDVGVYTATLQVRSEDSADPEIDVPVTLTVVESSSHYLPIIFKDS